MLIIMIIECDSRLVSAKRTKEVICIRFQYSDNIYTYAFKLYLRYILFVQRHTLFIYPLIYEMFSPKFRRSIISV